MRSEKTYGGHIWRVPIDKTKPVKIPFTANVSLDVGPEVRFAYKVDDAAGFTAHQIRDVAPSPDGSGSLTANGGMNLSGNGGANVSGATLDGYALINAGAASVKERKQLPGYCWVYSADGKTLVTLVYAKGGTATLHGWPWLRTAGS